MRQSIVAALASLAAVLAPDLAAAQGSNCQAIARGPERPLVRLASLAPDTVGITYVGHSAFRIEAPDGTTIVTDYSGNAGAGKVPDVATMNRAHPSHFTMFPDPAIAQVLPGWGMFGAGIDHYLTVGEVLIRNVSTDIRQSGLVEENGNSIFIFEVAGL